MNNEKNTETDHKKSLGERWAFRLALLGVALGIFAAFSQGASQPAIIIGFTIPFVCIFALIGGLIDFFRK